MIDLQAFAARQGFSTIMYPEGADRADGVVALDRWFAALSRQSKAVKVRPVKDLIDVLLEKEQWREALARTSQPHMLATALLASTMPGWPSEAGLSILSEWLGVTHSKLESYQAMPLFIDAMFGESFRLIAEAMLPVRDKKWSWWEAFDAISSLRPEFAPGVMPETPDRRAEMQALPALSLTP